MQGQANTGMTFEDVEKRPIAAIVSQLKDLLEISDRLVVVNAQQKRNRIHVMPSTWSPRKSHPEPAGRVVRTAAAAPVRVLRP